MVIVGGRRGYDVPGCEGGDGEWVVGVPRVSADRGSLVVRIGARGTARIPV